MCSLQIGCQQYTKKLFYPSLAWRINEYLSFISPWVTRENEKHRSGPGDGIDKLHYWYFSAQLVGNSTPVSSTTAIGFSLYNLWNPVSHTTSNFVNFPCVVSLPPVSRWECFHPEETITQHPIPSFLHLLDAFSNSSSENPLSLRMDDVCVWLFSSNGR